LLDIPWDSGAAAAEEPAAIAASLPSWQLGESSDGARLLAAARDHAARTDDPSYVEAIQLFIGEEQRHGAELGRYLDAIGVPRARRDWGDTVFRAIRHLTGRLEVTVGVLLMVEVHALPYYSALRRATGSAVLRRICDQILRDEVPHIRFQCERLAILHRNRSRALRALTFAVYRVLFVGITLAVWAGHRRALRAGGLGFRRFWRTAWTKMTHTWRTADPRAYRWGPESGE
jgi:hypothetical protein